jgi:hypothetical protein
MKHIRLIMMHSLGLILTTGVVYLSSLPFAQEAKADTWVDCAAEWQTCNIPDNPPTGATVRYGQEPVYSYKYYVGADLIACNNTTFGDPVPNVVKRCSYAFDVRPRSAPAQALHTILDTDDDPDDLDHSDFLAETLSEGEKIVSSNGVFELTLEDDGALVLSKVSGSGQGQKYRKTGDSTATAKDLYRLHMTEYGFEVRKNNNSQPVYSIAPDVSGDRNYALHLADNGYIRLVDMESYTNRWSAFPWNSEHTTPSEVSEDDIEGIWAKMGWTYTNSWTSTEHSALDGFDSHSHYHAHEVAQLMEDTPSLPDGRELFARQAIPQTEEKQSYIRDEPNLPQIRNSTGIAQFLSDVGKSINNGTLDLAQLFADDIEGVIEGRGLSEEGVESVLNSTSEGTRDENHRLGVAPVLKCSGSKFRGVGRRICNMLSKDKNSNKSIDYAVEIAPTYAVTALLNNPKVHTKTKSSGAVEQLQFRFFFKHPRLRGDRRYYTEVIIRVMDFSGKFVSTAFSSDRMSLGGAAVLGSVSMHDIILTYSWGANQDFRDDAKYEGMKYGATTGLTFDLEGTLATKDKNLSTNYNVQDTSVTPNNGFDFSDPTQNIELKGAEEEGIEAIVREQENVEATFKGIVEKLDLNASKTIEVGIGLGISTTYDLRKMAKEQDTTPANQLFRITMSEMAGAASAVFLGYASGTNTWAAATGNIVAATHLEIQAGGLVGDLAFAKLYKDNVANTDSIAQGFSVFWWTAAIGGISRDHNAAGLPARLENTFEKAYSTSIPIKMRMQYNQGIYDKPFYTQPSIRLSEYGIFALKTRYDKCIAEDASSNALLQQSCSQLSRQHLWLVNAIGGDTSEYVELRSFDSGKCIGLPDGSYTGNTVREGTDLRVVRCDSLVNPMAARWEAVYTGNDTLQLRSALDPTKCIDLDSGYNSDGTAMQVFSCENYSSNRIFSMVAADTFSDSIGEISTLRMAGNRCMDAVNQAEMPDNGVDFTVFGCNGRQAQNLVVEEADPGWYKLKVWNQDRYLAVSGFNEQKNNAVVNGWTSTANENQHWRPISRNDGTFALEVRSSGKCLQLNKDKDTDGATVLVQYDCDLDRKSQRFSLVNSRFELYGDLDSRGGSYLPFQSATQDSDYNSDGGAERAIDGNFDGYWQWDDTNSVTHSATNSDSYWQGDLGSSQKISEVYLYNRQDCCSERLNNFYVLISDIPFETGADLVSARENAKAEVNVTTQVNRYEPSKVSFDAGTTGQYVQVFMPSGYLSLAEVEARGPASATIEYCVVEGGNTKYEYIQSVALNGNSVETGNNNGYIFDSSTLPEFAVVKGSTATVTLRPGFESYNFNEYFHVWIDFNQDGVFEPGEKILEEISAAGEQIEVNFEVPSNDVAVGVTRMRVAMTYDGQEQTPCDDMVYGEFEDFAVGVL